VPVGFRHGQARARGSPACLWPWLLGLRSSGVVPLNIAACFRLFCTPPPPPKRLGIASLEWVPYISCTALQGRHRLCDPAVCFSGLWCGGLPWPPVALRPGLAPACPLPPPTARLGGNKSFGRLSEPGITGVADYSSINPSPSSKPSSNPSSNPNSNPSSPPPPPSPPVPRP
jgi:hypothetical protein